MRMKLVCMVFCVLMTTSMLVVTFPKGERDVSAMVQNIDQDEQSLIASEVEPPTGELTIIFGTDNNDHPGQGLGAAYHRSTDSYEYYTSYYDDEFQPLLYEYSSSTYSYEYEYRAWAVFDLSDLAQFSDVSITSGDIVYRQQYRSKISSLDFWTLNSIPYGYVYDSQAQQWFNEAGGSGTVNLGSVMFSGDYDGTNHNVTTSISAEGLSWLNNKVDTEEYDIPIGSRGTRIGSDYYASIRGGDVRFKLTFTYNLDLPDAGEIAMGDDLSGYIYASGYYTYNYDIGRISITPSYRAYATWDIDAIRAAIPQIDQYGDRIAVTGVSLRLNNHYSSCRLNTMGLYSMESDPRVADGATVYADSADGTQYVYVTDSTTYNYPIEFEWDLGEDALSDLQSTLDGESDFFAIGFSGPDCNAYCLGAPKLVIEWEIVPPEITVIFGTDSNDYPGQGLGRIYHSSSSSHSYYRSYLMNYFYNYKYESTSSDYTTEYRAWSVFDLNDLAQFGGVSITSGNIVYRQDYRSLVSSIDFWNLNSVPYDNFYDSQSQPWFNEAGGSGTVNLGSVMFSGNYDSTNQDISVPISANGLSWLNNKVEVGEYDIPIGSSLEGMSTYSASLYGGDVRLVLTLTYNELLHDTGEIALGDDLSGFATSSYNYDIGRLTTAYSNYRAYAIWDTESIRSAIPQTYRDDDEITVTGVSLRLNNHYYSCRPETMGLYSMESDPRVTAPETVYVDSADGTQYVYFPDRVDYYGPHEFEWNLGGDALTDLTNALAGSADFFAIGFSGPNCYAYYLGAPKLVIEWEVGREPPVADAGPDIAVDEGDSALLDGSSSYAPRGTIVAYDWDFESDGIFDYSETTESSPDGAFDGMTTHTYGDDGVYTVTLKVTDDLEASTTDTCDVTVYNMAPVIESFGPLVVNEGSPIAISAIVTDPGSDDLTLTWEWGDGTSPTSTVLYNDEIGPEPVYETSTNEIKSPVGTYPYSVSDGVTHTYGDNSIYTITFTAVDDDGGVTIYTTTIDVNNVAPSITEFTVPDSVDEGAGIACEAEVFDPGSDDLTFTWEFELGTTFTSVYYNDGVGTDPPESSEGTYPFSVTDSVSHIYSDNGEYLLSLTIVDDDGGTTTYSTTIIVYNVVPAITPFGPFVVDEGSVLDVTAFCTDPGSDDLTFTWEFGNSPTVTEVYYNDGVGSDPYPSPWGTSPFSATGSAGHTYDDNGFFTLTLTVEDDDGGITVYSTDITVNNVAPTAYAEFDQTVDEGAEATFVGDYSDPGTADTHTFMWNFGDGSPASSELSPTHAYGDNGVYTVYFTVIDDDGGADTDEVTVTVNNVAPSVDAGPDQIVYSGDTVEFSGTFTDPGWLDTHTMDWNFGDGQTDSGTLTPTHIYLIADTYGATLTVTDDDAGIGSDSLTVIVLRIPIIIDVKPCSDVNPINPKSKGKIPVAIINDGSFDPALVNPETVVFGPDGASPTHWSFKDVDDDGDCDLMLHFRTQETGITEGDTSVTLYADLYDGRQVVGENTIKTVPTKKGISIQGTIDANISESSQINNTSPSFMALIKTKDN